MSELSSPPPPAPRAFNPLAIWIPIIIIVLGVVVLNAYLMREKQRLASEEKERPPIYGRLEEDITLTERSGKTVRLSELRGKIIIASWVFTRCPRGCAGVLGKLKQLHKEIGNHPDVQFISFTLDPEDTPEMMKKFADGLSIAETDNWWFVNGDKDAVRAYMEKHFQFRPVKDMPIEERLSPDDKYIHDLRVAIADHQGHIRGLYDIMNADPEFQKFWDDKLRKDLAYLMRDKKEGR